MACSKDSRHYCYHYCDVIDRPDSLLHSAIVGPICADANFLPKFQVSHMEQVSVLEVPERQVLVALTAFLLLVACRPHFCARALVRMIVGEKNCAMLFHNSGKV
jgi:hypothetical protein|uniref:Uncharacterized protein n=1 Tax=Eutreptiella gymnastica TaxID=73025 RepID=A0A7S4GPU7_9EUGL|mmetsp:Transcript_8891/g.16956  ORF Transcript_8891/g.16956 Transcript_8891/m.16956 type:complete len:104 (-) Transcript_8891:98-409(-)